MSPGSFLATIGAAKAICRRHNETATVRDLEEAADAITAVLHDGHAAIAGALPNADGSATYCIPVRLIDSLSASLARVGGA